MNDFSFIDRLVAARPSRAMKWLLMILALFISIGIYRYFVDYFKKEQDFISIIGEALSFSRKEYKFYASGSEDDFSVYSKFSSEIQKYNNNKMSFEVAQDTANAIKNANRIVYSADAFGIVQSDTYLSVPQVDDDSKVHKIAPLYMERLHILVNAGKSNLVPGAVISSDDSASLEIIKQAINGGTLYAGSNYSGANVLLPHLLEVWEINLSYKLPMMERLQMQEMIERLQEGSDKTTPTVVMMFVGANEALLSKIDTLNGIRLLGISRGDAYQLNRNDDVDLMPTFFGEAYRDKGYSSVPTVGVMATLIGSSDLTIREMHDFVEMLDDIYENNDEFKRMSQDPPVEIGSILEGLKKNRDSKVAGFFRSFFAFCNIGHRCYRYFINVLLEY